MTAAANGLRQVTRSEWTKLWSLRSTVFCVALTIGLTALMATLSAAGTSTSGVGAVPADIRPFSSQFVHQTIEGNGSLVARVASQSGAGSDAMAGLLLTDQVTGPEAGYAAVMVTPQGVRWQGDFTDFVDGTTGPAPRWLRLTRIGTTISGAESADGISWTRVGRIDLPRLPRSVEIGMFVAAPPTGEACTRTGGGSTSCGPKFELSTAEFDSVALSGHGGTPITGSWQGVDTAGPPKTAPDEVVAGSFAEAGGTFTVHGAGDLGQLGGNFGADDDLVRDSLGGVVVGFIAMAVLGILFVTSEYRRDLIRTTFTATPRRGVVLAAKAAVLAPAAFAAGVVAAVASFLISQPILRGNGFTSKNGYPPQALTDGPVARAVVGTGLVLALLTVLGLALGVAIRRAAPAITLVVAAVILPLMIGPFLSLDGEAWLKRLTPAAGFAIQQTKDRFDTAIGPWPGLAVLCGYAAVALALAYVRLRRSDV
jgi:hypothetical protein